MALKALDIYKILPKKNCKECGEPTCLTFAMKLASGKGDVNLCPYLDAEARELLGASTKPPVAKVTIGVGERSVTIGEETVFFRHEKTFVHPPGIFFEVSDLDSDEAIHAVATRVFSESFVRIGQSLQWSGLAVRCRSQSPERYAAVVDSIEKKGYHLPLVLVADTPALLEAALPRAGQFRPLLHAARQDTANEMSTLARNYGCPLVVADPDHDRLLSLATRSEGAIGQDLLLDASPATLRELLVSSSRIRMEAISRVPGAGYPLYVDAGGIEGTISAVLLAVLKFGGVIVTPPLDAASARAALTLRQNIYTDP